MERKDRLEELLVPIDVSKYFHKGMIMGPHGEVIQGPFEIDIYQDGFERLLNQINQAKTKSGIDRVIFAVEPTSYYHQGLLEQLVGAGHEVRLVDPWVVSKVRGLYHRKVKTDDIDLEMIGKTMSWGKGNLPPPKDGRSDYVVTRGNILGR